MEEATTKSGMSTGMVIGIAVLVAIVFGGGAYAYVNNKAEKEKKDLSAQITELQSQVSSGTVATTTTPSSSTSATDETADWKLYSNSEFGFSVKYPSSYSAINASSYSDNDGVHISSSASVTSGPHTVSIEAHQVSDSLDSYIASRSKDQTFSEATKTTLAGLAAYEGVDNGMTSTYGIITKKGLNIIEIVFDTGNVDGLAKSKSALTAVQKQILSTFQFTK